MKKTQQELLYEQYKYYSDEQLKEIANSNEYDEVAHKVAKQILGEDRTEYKEFVKKAEQKQNESEAKQQEKENNPLYEDIHRMANDIRFLKNVVIGFIVLNVISCIVLIISTIK
jgi:hypothetical protein